MTVTVVSFVTDGESAAFIGPAAESRAGVCAAILPPTSANDNAKANFITSSFVFMRACTACAAIDSFW
jgi:hypothetical protein